MRINKKFVVAIGVFFMACMAMSITMALNVPAAAASDQVCTDTVPASTVLDSCPAGTEVDPNNPNQCREAHTTVSCPVVHFETDRYYCPSGGLLIFHTCWKGFNSYPATYEPFSTDVPYGEHANGWCKRPSPAPVPTWAIPAYNLTLPVFLPEEESEPTYTYAPRPNHLECAPGGTLENGACTVVVDCPVVDVCTNLPEVQVSLPENHHFEGEGICMPNATEEPTEPVETDEPTETVEPTEEPCEVDCEPTVTPPAPAAAEPQHLMRVFFRMDVPADMVNVLQFEWTNSGDYIYQGNNVLNHVKTFINGYVEDEQGRMWYTDMPVEEFPTDDPCLIGLHLAGDPERLHPITVQFFDKGGDHKWGDSGQYSDVTCNVP